MCQLVGGSYRERRYLQCQPCSARYLPTCRQTSGVKQEGSDYLFGRSTALHFSSPPLHLRPVDNGKIMIRGCLVIQEYIHRFVCIATPQLLCSSRAGSCCLFVACLLLNHGQLANFFKLSMTAPAPAPRFLVYSRGGWLPGVRGRAAHSEHVKQPWKLEDSV